MAGLETVVRPVVFPNIRPAPPRSLPPADDPEKGFAIIKGQPAKQIDLTYSYSMSASSSGHKETQRTVDVARIYQKEDDGTVNRENYVDVEVANEVHMVGPRQWNTGTIRPGGSREAADPNGSFEKSRWKVFYKRAEESDNIEIKERNTVRKNPEGEE